MMNCLRRYLITLFGGQKGYGEVLASTPGLDRQSDTIQLIISNLPPIVRSGQAEQREMCHEFLHCAVPMIYSCKPAGLVVTHAWLSDQLTSVSLVHLLISGKGNHGLRAPLDGWFLKIPGATRQGLDSGSLPSVFHGKCRSITQDIFSAIERASLQGKTEFV